MKIDYHKRFLKNLARAPHHIQLVVSKRIRLFSIDPFYGLLNNHALVGKWQGHRSINVTGDWRAIYRDLGDGRIEWVEFGELGTHRDLYD